MPALVAILAAVRGERAERGKDRAGHARDQRRQEQRTERGHAPVRAVSRELAECLVQASAVVGALAHQIRDEREGDAEHRPDEHEVRGTAAGRAPLDPSVQRDEDERRDRDRDARRSPQARSSKTHALANGAHGCSLPSGSAGAGAPNTGAGVTGRGRAAPT